MKGSLLIESGEYEQAIESFRQVVLPIAKWSLANAYKLEGDQEKADSIYCSILKESEERYISPMVIALTNYDLGKEEMGLKGIEEVLKINEGGINERLFLELYPRLEELRTRLGNIPMHSW